MTDFSELSRIQLMMAQAIGDVAEGMAGAAEGAFVTLLTQMCGGAAYDGVNPILNAYNPSYWPLIGRRNANPSLSVYSEDLMLMSGEIRAFATHLVNVPGAGTRAFTLVKNETLLSNPDTSYASAEQGFKEATVGLPLSFVKGDRIGVRESWTGTPTDGNVSWTVLVRMKVSS